MLADGVIIGVYGLVCIYNDGFECGVYWGFDWVNVEGILVVVFVSGFVILVELDMYYEGGLIFIDYG